MPRKSYHLEEFCGDCKHFCRHYVKLKESYLPTRFGHCIHPRVKERRDDEHCPHWCAGQESQ